MNLMRAIWKKRNRLGLAAGATVFLVVGLLSPAGVLAAKPPKAAVAPTKPPSPYGVPKGATVVHTASGLARALGSSRSRDIVLADGVYDQSEPFTNRHGDRIYAQHLGRAILKAGLVVGGPTGPGGARIQGVVFDISDSAKVSMDGIVYTWGASSDNLQVLDCVFLGNKQIDVGLYAYNAQGLDAERLIFMGFTGVALRASNNDGVDYHAGTPIINTISDIRINGVSRPTPGASNGTSEAGLWVGQPVKNGVHRVRIRNVSISGIETVNNSWDTTFSDLDIDMSGPNASSAVGVYMEHMSLHNTFTNFKISGTRLGFNTEWNHGVPGGAASHFSVIKNGTIDAAGWAGGDETVGVNLDEGTESTTVAGVTFHHQTYAGIAAYKNEGANHFDGNKFSLAKGATPISTGHV
jgi:hypothetical protein